MQVKCNFKEKIAKVICVLLIQTKQFHELSS